jgi:carboxyl-terminal processing protease
LTNGGSASASEIVAGALHDNGAAYVVGQKTYGKGVVQQLINLCEHPVIDEGTCNGDAGQLKVTVASWYRPNGQNINKKGINPDQAIKPADGDKAGGPDAQLQAAEAYLSSKTN